MVLLISCNSNKYNDYRILVEQASAIKIEFADDEKSFFLSKTEATKLKTILINDIKVTSTKEFSGKIKIELIKGNKITGFFVFSNNQLNPCGNFNSDNIRFGFKMSYRLEMFLEKIQ